MADGSRSSVIEAEQAAADAARDARDEVLQRARTEKAATAPPKAESASKKKNAKPEWHDFTVDVWITNFNSVEFGIFKHSRNRAKSRQFTLDMDVFAEVIENGERTGLIAYREDLWRKTTGMDRRLVLKLFGEKLNWRATMDLMLGRSLQLTVGAGGLPVTAFSVNVGEQIHNVYLERSAYKWPLMPETFSFQMLTDAEPTFFRLRRDFINLGGDYTLYDQRDQRIGRLNGAIFTLGGKWHARVLKQYADPRMLHVLKLFCGMQVFNRQCRSHVRNLSRGVRNGTVIPHLDRQEADLYMNPRRMR